MLENHYDLIIIGGGPSGITAGIYSSRAGIKTLLIEKALIGGQINYTERIENYPGFNDGISGFELSKRLESQVKELGLPIKQGEVKDIIFQKKKKVVILEGDLRICSNAVIISTGAVPKKLGVEGEERFIGRGVSYCATCDGPLFKNRKIAVVGGGDRALEEALFLSKIAKDVYLIHRRDKFRGTFILQKKIAAENNIHLLLNTVVESIKGHEFLQSLDLRNVKSHEKKELSIDGIFIFVGIHPNSEIVKDKLKLDNMGFIITNDSMETSIEGVFAAGDVRSKQLRQITTAVGDGACAAFSAQKYLENL